MKKIPTKIICLEDELSEYNLTCTARAVNIALKTRFVRCGVIKTGWMPNVLGIFLKDKLIHEFTIEESLDLIHIKNEAVKIERIILSTNKALNELYREKTERESQDN